MSFSRSFGEVLWHWCTIAPLRQEEFTQMSFLSHLHQEGGAFAASVFWLEGRANNPPTGSSWFHLTQCWCSSWTILGGARRH